MTRVRSRPGRRAGTRTASLVLALVAAAASALALTVPAGTAAPGASDACSRMGDLGLSHGRCVALEQELGYFEDGGKDGRGATDAVETCKTLDANLTSAGLGGLQGYGITMGQCVLLYRSI